MRRNVNNEADSSITVLTLTRNRPGKLERAIRSVQSQDYSGRLRHFIIVDGDTTGYDHLMRASRGLPREVSWHVVRRLPTERGPAADERAMVYPRIARLLNTGIALASSEWVSFLDDDNEFEPNHLSSLMAVAMATESPAVHSARRVFWPDGSPYLETYFPGAPNPEDGKRIFQLMVEKGVWIRGTNILQDRIDPGPMTFRNSTVIARDDPIFLVDQNLWLIRRELLARTGIPDVFSNDDIDENTCPDDKLLEALVRSGVRVSSSRLPTVRYYVGGISNGAEQPGPDKSIDAEDHHARH